MKKIVAFIPNLLTMGNLACGLLAILSITIFMDLFSAFWLVVAAAVFDFLDGAAARLLRAYSPLGAQLDSLSDMVSFGVVPSIAMITTLAIMGGGWLLCIAGGLLALCAAYRLAKFNVDTRQSEEFRGLPTPAMALGVMSLALSANVLNYYVLAIICLVLCVLMVCDMPMFSLKFKNLAINDNIIRYVFLLSCVIIIVVAGLYAALALIVGLYIVMSALLAVTHRR